MPSSRISGARLVQYAVVGYVSVSVLYTTSYLLASPVGSTILSLLGTSNPHPYDEVSASVAQPRVDLVTRARQILEAQHRSTEGSSEAPAWTAGSSDSLIYWTLPNTDSVEGLVNDDTVPILEETFLSKAFAQALHPTRLIPFYYKATSVVDPEDVTISTLVTSNRYKVLKQLVERYQGPISVTIHIPLPPDGSRNATATNQFISAVKDLEALYTSSPHFATYVDVHLALSPFSSTSKPSTGTTEGGRQFNVWRNVARLFARTEFVMMLDVDFAVCTDWRSTIREAVAGRHVIGEPGDALSSTRPGKNETLRQEVFEKLRAGTAALVVPAFEYAKQEDGVDQSTFPRDKESLVRLATGLNPRITMFHASWAPGHNSTDYPKYMSIPAGADEVYKVTTYQSAYEPYVIMSKRVTWCDERFTGYGGNKAACLFEIYLSGVSFYVLSDHFLIHQSHRYEEEARREERKYNRKLYTDFKEEACLRYLYYFHASGLSQSPLASNAKEECQKSKSVAKLATELLGNLT